MRNFIRTTSLCAVVVCCGLSVGCVSFEPARQSTVETRDRPTVAIVPFGFDLRITKLSSVHTVSAKLSAEEEARQLAEALHAIQQEARWLFLSRLAAGQGVWIVPLDETDALVQEVQLQAGTEPTPEQLKAFRERLGADLVVTGSILDYGKVRWQWLAAGMFADISWETVALGLATAWNPPLILGNVGFELLTSTPVWFGGGYLFGVAFRPVRVQVRAFETFEGTQIWKSTDESAYAWRELKKLPKDVRDKKEAQLELNLAEVMESLGDSFTKQELKAFDLRGQREAVSPMTSPAIGLVQ